MNYVCYRASLFYHYICCLQNCFVSSCCLFVVMFGVRLLSFCQCIVSLLNIMIFRRIWSFVLCVPAFSLYSYSFFIIFLLLLRILPTTTNRHQHHHCRRRCYNQLSGSATSLAMIMVILMKGATGQTQ